MTTQTNKLIFTKPNRLPKTSLSPVWFTAILDNCNKLTTSFTIMPSWGLSRSSFEKISLMLNNFCVSKCDFAKGLDFSAQLVKTFFSLCLPNIAAKRFYMILLKKEVRIHSFTLYFWSAHNLKSLLKFSSHTI